MKRQTIKNKEKIIQDHNLRILERFSDLNETEYSSSDEALMPSCIVDIEVTEELLTWAKLELFLRVGLGHELLQLIRTTAALYCYYNKKQKEARGKAQMDKVTKSQRSASSKRSESVRAYILNWRKIERLLSTYPSLSRARRGILKGLQVLNREEDVVYFEEWGERTLEYTAQLRLNVSWIWRVAMEHDSSVVTNEEGSIAALTDAWEAEGR
jgi:hypothetical protein